jgi:RNA polymerase sigma-70 factor (ECF subfamily)
VRRDIRGRELMQKAAEESRYGDVPLPGEDTANMRDDQLRLIFTCCHPAIKVEHQVALTLRLIGGMSPAEAARAFLVRRRHHRQAAGPRQVQDQVGAHPVPGARRRRAA